MNCGQPFHKKLQRPRILAVVGVQFGDCLDRILNVGRQDCCFGDHRVSSIRFFIDLVERRQPAALEV